MGIGEKRKFKEQEGPSGLGRNAQDEKIDEMAKLIKDLSNKLSKMEMEKDKPDSYVRNPNKFGININTNP